MAEDSLALSLAKAAADPAHKPEFARALLASTIFVMGEIEGEDPPARSQPITGGANVSLRTHLTPEGMTVVPFFSSLEKLRGFIKSQASYLAMPTKKLFEIARGSTLVLNPGSDVSSQISPEDIEKLMLQAPRV